MLLRTNPPNDFSSYHSGPLHSVEPESVSTHPDALTQPQKAQISESLNCYHAAYGAVHPGKKKHDSRSGSQSRVYQDRSFFKRKASPASSPVERQAQPRPAISFGQIPTKKAGPRKQINKKAGSPEKQLDSEWYQITRLDTIGSLDETVKSKPQCEMK